MAEQKRFFVVVQAGVDDPIARTFTDRVDADKAAQDLALTSLGETFVVFEPTEAYRSSKPRAEKVFLMWRAEPDVPEPPPAPEPASIEI